MRIGIFTDTYLPDINGVVTSVLTLKKALELFGHEVYVVTNHDDLLKTKYEDKVLYLPGLKLDFLYGYKLTNPIQIAAAKPIKSWNLDIIHVHQEFGVGIFGRAVAQAFDIPLVSTYHTTYEDYTHYINVLHIDKIDELVKKAIEGLSKTFTKKSNIVIAPSEKTKKMLEGYGIKNQIEVIPTGLDLQRFNKNFIDQRKIDAIKKEYNLLDDNTIFIYVGRLAKEKSIDMLIDAFEIVKNKKLPAKLLIVGDGPDRKNLEKQVKSLKLEASVVFAGAKNSNEIPNYYHAADAFISGSTTETQGLTYIEALASGLGLFARKDDVLKGIVIEGETGFYFDDIKDLANKIESFILNHDFKKQIREKALTVSKQFGLEEYYKMIIKCYNEAIENDQDDKN